MACRICDQVFFDNESLIDHFQSHFHQNRTFNPRSHTQSLSSPESGTKFFSSSTQLTHSMSLPVNVRNSAANGCVGPHARDSILPNPPNLLLMGNYPNPNLLPNYIQLRGTTLNLRPPFYPSSSIIRSSVNQRTFASQSNQPSNFHFSVSPSITAVQPIRRSSFCSPSSICASASQSNPGTSGIARGTTTSSIIATFKKNEIEDVSSGYTKPYIMQLEQPIVEMMMLGKNNVGGDSNPDEMDLTLKL